MDGNFGGDGGRGPYEMLGTVAQWNGTSGEIISTSGERVGIHRLALVVHGFDQPIKVGDRVRFWASKRVRITYSLEDISMIVPQEPDAAALRRLRDLNRAVEKQRNGDDLPELPTKEFTGVIDAYDPQKGYGVIRCDNGERVSLNIVSLRASGFKEVTCGSVVRFDAIERPKGWIAFRILSLEQPSSQSH